MADDDPLREAADLDYAGLDRSDLKVCMKFHVNWLGEGPRDMFPLINQAKGWRVAKFTHADGSVCQEPNECRAEHDVMVFR